MSRAALVLAACLLTSACATGAAPQLSQSPSEAARALDPFTETTYLYVVDLKADRPKNDNLSILPDLFNYVPAANRADVNKRAWAMLGKLGLALPEGSGALLRVRVLTNDVTPPALPPEFLIPLGAGADPLDAYAEYLNLPFAQMEAPPPGLRDVGYLLWISNLGQGKLHVGVIPRSREVALHREGTLLANRKVELRQRGITYKTYGVPDYSVRAAYWQDRLRTVETQIADEQRRRAIQALVQRFAEAQQEHTRILQEAAETKRRKSDLDALIGALETIVAVGKAINSNLPKLIAFLDRQALQKESGERRADISRSSVDAKAAAQIVKSLDEQLSAVPELKS